MPFSWQRVVYTPPICITMRLPFVSRYFCRSIRVRGHWCTPNFLPCPPQPSPGIFFPKIPSFWELRSTLSIGRHSVGAWIGGVWNGRFPESENYFSETEISRRIPEIPQKELFSPNFRLRNLKIQSPKKCSSIPPAIPYPHTRPPPILVEKRQLAGARFWTGLLAPQEKKKNPFVWRARKGELAILPIYGKNVKF